MYILAIESSHDDTSVVLYRNQNIIADYSFSQIEFHKQYGGTIPEYASRLHFKNFKKIIVKLMNHNLTDLDYVAYTAFPGLTGSLNMGMVFAKTIAQFFNVKLFPVNHIHGHIFSVEFSHKIIYPAISLIVSGGHTQLWFMKDKNNFNLIGETADDAAGEVFDKVARFLKLSYPGGPIIDKLSNNSPYSLKLNVNLDQSYNFSFSGLKTQVKNIIDSKKYSNQDIINAFQNKIVEVLIFKTKLAIEEYKPKSIVLGGGVAANTLLRKEFTLIHNHALIPELKYTTDNASMIAIACDILVK